MVSRVRAPSLDPDRQNKVQFGEFVPSTDSARKLREMYLAKDEDIDLARLTGSSPQTCLSFPI